SSFVCQALPLRALSRHVRPEGSGSRTGASERDAGCRSAAGGTMMVSEEGLEKGMFAKIRVFLEMIKFSHTVFALPFAFTGAVLAADGMPAAHQVFWILMAMVGARTAAMGMNRLIDAEIDARNPRTASRAIP